jgi:hypothetical protein
MSNARRFRRERTGLLIPKSSAPEPLGLDPTITKIEIPTIGVACPRPKGNGTDQCAMGGEPLPCKHVHRLADDLVEYGYHCDGCGYETTMTMRGGGQLR